MHRTHRAERIDVAQSHCNRRDYWRPATRHRKLYAVCSVRIFFRPDVADHNNPAWTISDRDLTAGPIRDNS